MPLPFKYAPALDVGRQAGALVPGSARGFAFPCGAPSPLPLPCTARVCLRLREPWQAWVPVSVLARAPGSEERLRPHPSEGAQQEATPRSSSLRVAIDF